MPRYEVVGPEYGTQLWGPHYPDSGGPTEYGRDAWLVDAPNANRAKWAAWRSSPDWQDINGSDGLHPLTGAIAVKVPAECPSDCEGCDGVGCWTPEAWGAFYIEDVYASEED